MFFEISSFYREEKIRLKPRVGLAIVLDEVDQNENVTE